MDEEKPTDIAEGDSSQSGKLVVQPAPISTKKKNKAADEIEIPILEVN